MKVRMGSLGVFLLLLSAACEPPRLPSVEEIAGRYEDDSIIKSTRKTLVLRADGSFTFTTLD